MSRETGFSMIEVLVALVLISIGVLGMVAMQGRTIQYTQESVQRNAAAMLASDLMEIMRADPDAVLNLRDQLREDSVYYKAKGSDFPAAPARCAPLPADAKERLGCWAQQASKDLPGASALLNSQFYICRSPTPGTCDNTKGSAIEIQVAWRAMDGACFNASDSTLCTYSVRSEL